MQSCLDQASVAAIPRGCRFDPVPFWCEEIDKLILIRDQRRLDAHESEEQRVEWISACRDVVNLINEKREECWKEFASTLRYGSAAGKTANAVKSIGREARSSSSIVIVSNGGKLLSKDIQKATAFRGEYAKVCKNPKLPKDRDFKSVRRREKIEVSRYCSEKNDDAQGSPYSFLELDSALHALKMGKTPGEDDIHNEMLVQLTGEAREELLAILSLSWCTGQVPSSWMRGVIIPLHKAGKDKGQLGSYRPVCLMSVIAKLAERMICNRLRCDLESRGM